MAAALEGRQYIGLEISDEYCQLARQRIAATLAGVSTANDPAPALPDALAVRDALLPQPAVPR